MKVVILGGGNIGTALAALISAGGHAVTVLSSRPESFSDRILYTDSVSGESFSAPVSAAGDMAEIEGADVLFFTQPSFCLAKTVKEMEPYWKKETPLGIVPGSGGAEFYLARFIRKGHTVFGLDRVPCIARVQEYGKSVSAHAKDSVRLAALPAAETGAMAALCRSLLGIGCEELSNYLTVTFTPSNPILHTARLYGLYHQSADHTFAENPPFYESWDDASSEYLLDCDRELQSLCRAIKGLDLTGVVSLKEHYGVRDTGEMTKKLSSIPAFRGISSPMKKREDGRFVLDTESRYFAEDFPYGLLILLAFCRLYDSPAARMEEIFLWYQSLCKKEYFKSGALVGRDAPLAPIPQNFLLDTPENILAFYKA